jgi:hypothetical protein
VVTLINEAAEKVDTQAAKRVITPLNAEFTGQIGLMQNTTGMARKASTLVSPEGCLETERHQSINGFEDHERGCLPNQGAKPADARAAKESNDKHTER